MVDKPEDEDRAVVHVLPAGIDIVTDPGQPLMRAAQAMGIRWPNVCNGQAQCGVCAVEVVLGDLSSCPPTLREQQMLGRLAQKPLMAGAMRLACQLCPKSALTVQRMGVRAPAGRTECDE